MFYLKQMQSLLSPTWEPRILCKIIYYEMDSKDAVWNIELENRYTDPENEISCSSEMLVPNPQNSVKSQKMYRDQNVPFYKH